MIPEAQGDPSQDYSALDVFARMPELPSSSERWTAAFFNAIDQGRPAGTTTRTQGSSGSGAAANLTPTPSGRAPASTTTNAPSGTAAANKSTLAARAGTPPTQKK